MTNYNGVHNVLSKEECVNIL